MVSDEIIKYRVNRSTLWIADSFVETGFCKTLSEFARQAITEQIGIDLHTLETGSRPEIPGTELPAYTSRYAEESELHSIRLTRTTCRTIDLLIEHGFTENRSAYIRRAVTEQCRRQRERLFAAAEKAEQQTAVQDEESLRRICREEIREYHRAAQQYFA